VSQPVEMRSVNGYHNTAKYEPIMRMSMVSVLTFRCSIFCIKLMYLSVDPALVHHMVFSALGVRLTDTSCNYPSSGWSSTRAFGARCSAPAAPRLVTRAVITRRPDGVS